MSAREVIARAISEATLDWEDEDPEVWAVHTMQADAILAALSAAGYAVVPVEPTRAMRHAFHEANMEYERAGIGFSPDKQWSAMLAAAKEDSSDE